MSEPSNPLDELYRLALAHARAGEVEETVRCYRRILKIAPEDAHAHYKLGTFLLEIKHPDLAIPHLKAAVDLGPDKQKFWLAHLRGLLAANRPWDARMALEGALQTFANVDPRFLELVANLKALEQAAAIDPRRPVPLPDVVDKDFYAILAKAWPHSMSSVYGFVESFHSLYQSVHYVVRRGIPGAFVECGCYAGGMSLLAALTFLQRGDTSRHLYLFDTFEGMPPPSAEDGEAVVHSYNRNTVDGQTWSKIDIERVRAVMASSGYPLDKIHLFKGLIEDSIPKFAPETVAILRLDTDFYGSTKHELTHLYPRLSLGGIAIFDDYGYLPGAKRAVDEYFASMEQPVLLHRINFAVRTAIKT
jgi:tetratricopeptide (TPR) repeat protein